MAMNQGLIGEFDHEMIGTRKTLERIPEDKFDWAPHQKSMKLGKLALHLAMLPGWVKETMTLDSLDIGKGAAPPVVKNRAEILAIFDKNVEVAKGILQSSTDDAQFFKPWSLLNNGATILTMPKIAVLRSFVFNHTVHHRAQLGVYLRLNDIAVPSIYGPSADEGNF
jgi:uncharacterized damage-inducible protein DinB